MKGCPVFGFHIINLHKTDIKRAARAGLFDVLKKHAFCMSPLRLDRKMLMFGTPRIALLKKEKCCCKYDLILQQHLLGFYSACFVNVITVPSKRGRYL